MKSGFTMLLSGTLTLFLSSCIKPEYKVESYFMENITLDQQVVEQKKVYIHLTNSTIFADLSLEEELKNKFKNHGFEILKTSKNSPLMINVNIKYHGIAHHPKQTNQLQDSFIKSKNFTDYTTQTNKRNEEFNINDFFNFSLGSVAGFFTFSHIGFAFASGLSTYYIGTKIKQANKLKQLLTVVDVVISETSEDQIKTYDFREVKQGAGGSRKVNFNSQTSFKQYQSRLVILSNGGNLNTITQNIISSIYGAI